MMETKFNFISGDDFRKSLDNDYKEMKKAFESESWKSLHVLAGSIVEAILTDYLVSIDYKSKRKSDPLQMDLDKIIKACNDEGVISNNIVDLSNVIRNYRNLIHPGRMIRLKEKIDINSGNIAMSLVEIIIEEVAETRQKTYGFTAEQIVSKIEKDKSAIFIIEDLLNVTQKYEIERLLMSVIPNTYMDYRLKSLTEYGFSEYRTMENLQTCFRKAFNIADYLIKKKVTGHFVKLLKEESEEIVLTYETTFFKCSDLEYLSDKDIKVVKKHILSRLEKESISVSLIQALEGIGEYLGETEIRQFVKPLILSLTDSTEKEIREEAEDTLIVEYYRVSDNETYEKIIDDYIEENQDIPRWKNFVDRLKEIRESFVPF